ncbi:tellurite resistance TerB family protein [Roseovarius indicus]|uniref:tellurite resistance TerB family protein n=1 Tax=Roseovarius indicus TaxID=540747 RepID=UPI0007D8EAD6|nr:WYL domain-containing protein [Roseovarius indicus]OAO09472.1 hypothetical protein A8B76_24465 [Roseovarius indicus]
MPFWDIWLNAFRERDEKAPQIVEHCSDTDTDVEDDVPSEACESDFLDGIIFGMTYKDANGHVSRRTISAMDFVEERDCVYLRGVCHLRNAYRSFRADRIVEIITADGEVLEPIAFWKQIGISQVLISRILTPPTTKSAKPKAPRRPVVTETTPDSPGMVQRRLVRHQVRLLAALSRSDGNMRPEEIDEILEFICIECDDAGIGFEETDLAALRAYVGRLRPTSDKVEESLAKLFLPDSPELLKQGQVRNLRNAMRGVIDADGVLHEGEVLFAQAFDSWMKEAGTGHAAPSS